jgi:hypothetical protein
VANMRQRLQIYICVVRVRTPVEVLAVYQVTTLQGK